MIAGFLHRKGVRAPAVNVLFAAAAVSLVSCITVNIYFPAPEVRQAAEKIVEETWGEKTESAEKESEGSSALHWWLDAVGPARAQAQDVDINVSTAAIRALKESMRARAEQLKPHLRAGHVGIGNDGMLVVRDLEGVPLREQATIRRLVEAENRDRASLYREISKANDFGEGRVADIQKIFADVWVQKAEKGWPIQKKDGSWTTK
jgi:uncharacterized protein YdbL (DUF1318 family)